MIHAPQLLADLTRLLERDGLDEHEVVGTSTRSGAGLDDLRARLHDAVEGDALGRDDPCHGSTPFHTVQSCFAQNVDY